MRHVRVRAPNGDAGTEAMVRQMRRIIASSFTHPVVRSAAVAIVRHVPERDYPAQIRALREWMKQHVRFLRDPLGVELSYDVPVMIETIAKHGVANVDCDDAAVLAASLGKSIGLPARLVLLAFRGARPTPGSPAPWAHVYAELSPPGALSWIEMDTTRSQRELPVNMIVRRAEIVA